MGVVIGSGSPRLFVEVSAEQTWASGTQRTIKVSFGAKVNGSTSQSWFGYPAEFQIYVNGAWSGSWIRFKGNESWNATNGLRWFSHSMTTDVGTTGSKDITVGIKTVSRGSNNWDGQHTWTFRVGSTNSRPSISGAVSTNPSGIFSERIGSVAVTSPTGSDPEGNIAGYQFQTSINGGGWANIYRGSSRTYNHDISGYGEGTSFQYRTYVYDSGGLDSADWVYSSTIYKNRFTMATLASSGSISSGTSSIAFTWSGGTNTQSTSLSYSLSCEGLTVYNASSVSSPCTVKITRGSSESGPYIKWSDLVAKFNNSTNKGKGTLNFVLTGRNGNGSTKTSKKSISVNTQEASSSFSSSISTSASESTIYKRVADTGVYYFIPDGVGRVRVKWSTSTGAPGDKITYKIFIAYDTGGWQELGSTSSTYYDYVIPKQNKKRTIKFLVRAISSFNSGVYKDAETPAQTIHFYDGPSLTRGNVTRTATSAEIRVTVKSLSSITGINTKGTWSCNNGSSGRLTQSQSEQVINIANLSENSTYVLTVTYNDGTELTKDNKSASIEISANLPIFFINKYGIGVGGAKAESEKSLNVKGSAWISDIEKSNLVGGGAHGSNKVENANNIWRSGFYDYYAGTNYPTQNTWYWLLNVAHTNNSPGYRYGLQIAAENSTNNFFMRTTNSNGEGSWQRLYHTGYKPRPIDIGALPTAGGTVTGMLAVNNVLKAYRYSNSNNAAAITMDKPGDGSFGIGANGRGMEIQYGRTNDMDGTWSSVQDLIHNFKGNIRINDKEIMKSQYFLFKGNNSSVKINFPEPATTYYARLRIFCRNKQEFSAAYFYVNGSYQTDWTLGAHFEVDIEFGYTGNGWVITHEVRNQFRNDSNYGAHNWTTFLQEGSINNFEIRHGMSGYYLQDVCCLLEWRGIN